MKGKVSHGYNIFGSAARGISEVEDRAKSILVEKETAENLDVFARAIGAEWKQTDKNVSSLRLAFSDFEKILEKQKPEISKFLTLEREKRMAAKRSSLLHGSSSF
ncbi:hypothetical protein [Dyadobacter sp. CY312]|uniref:hypothetical protein n=1 Tax=Dyadobacter sp. CY312 TaxID=2907303 RepID=UPI001F32EE6F|nr:hypothetical protein [Dyadobacter sp. CY312]MCE7041653.1 hypothetical protein [Dyadobacter sp. CY312]